MYLYHGSLAVVHFLFFFMLIFSNSFGPLDRVLFQQFLYGDEAVALFLQLRERLAKAFDGLAAVAAAIVHQDDVAGAGALDALGNNVGAGLLPVGGINVPADFRRNNAFKVGGNRSVKIAAWATENSVSS